MLFGCLGCSNTTDRRRDDADANGQGRMVPAGGEEGRRGRRRSSSTCCCLHQSRRRIHHHHHHRSHSEGGNHHGHHHRRRISDTGPGGENQGRDESARLQGSDTAVLLPNGAHTSSADDGNDDDDDDDEGGLLQLKRATSRSMNASAQTRPPRSSTTTGMQLMGATTCNSGTSSAGTHPTTISLRPIPEHRPRGKFEADHTRHDVLSPATTTAAATTLVEPSPGAHVLTSPHSAQLPAAVCETYNQKTQLHEEQLRRQQQRQLAASSLTGEYRNNSSTGRTVVSAGGVVVGGDMAVKMLGPSPPLRSSPGPNDEHRDQAHLQQTHHQTELDTNALGGAALPNSLGTTPTKQPPTTTKELQRRQEHEDVHDVAFGLGDSDGPLGGGGGLVTAGSKRERVGSSEELGGSLMSPTMVSPTTHSPHAEKVLGGSSGCGSTGGPTSSRAMASAMFSGSGSATAGKQRVPLSESLTGVGAPRIATTPTKKKKKKKSGPPI